MKNKLLVFSASSLLLLGSCATIISGSKQKFKIDSTPQSATVTIDSVEVGKTPFETKLERKKPHTVKITLEGHKPYEVTLTKKFNEVYLGNILIGGVIGFIIDPITGAMFRLEPKEINAQLEQGVAFKKTSNQIYIAVSMKIDPRWQKIGQMEKISE